MPEKKTVADLTEELSQVVDQCRTMLARMGDLEARLEIMEVAKPPELKRLTVESVENIVENDPFARFEVLLHWKTATHNIPVGTVIRADHFPRLVDYVRAGLCVGVPDNQAEAITRMRLEAEAHARLRAEETRLARVAADRAAAELHADRVQGMKG